MSDRFHELLAQLAAYDANQAAEPTTPELARHEAGHAVVAYRVGLVNIVSSLLGVPWSHGQPHTSADGEDPVKLAAMCWGGLLAERTLGRSCKLDLDRLQDAGELDRDSPSEAFTIAEGIIAADGAALDRVAEALVASDVLMHDDVADLCGQVEAEQRRAD